MATLPPRWSKQTMQQLTGISALRTDWDSYGAPAISPSTIRRAYRLIQSIAEERIPPPRCVPTPEGSIQLEWHTDDFDLEVLLMPGTQLEVVFEDHRREFAEYEKVLRSDVAPLVEHMRLLGVRAQSRRL